MWNNTDHNLYYFDNEYWNIELFVYLSSIIDYKVQNNCC